MPVHLKEILDTAERAGRLNLRTDEIAAALPDVGPEALRQALHRQQRRGRLVRLSRGAEHWLIVPLHHAQSGAPPLETWLDRYLGKTLGIPYYVALLSAAELYGASPYGVMVTQVMVSKPRRPIRIGRHQLQFHVQKRVDQLPTRWHETPEGRFKLSTPELTALDLVQRESLVGGMARVREVLRALHDRCSAAGLSEALESFGEVPTAQRLGALLALDQSPELAAQVAQWLEGKRHRAIVIESHADDGRAQVLDHRFKVWMPLASWSANT